MSKAEIFGLKTLILCLMFLIGILIFPKFVFAANINFSLETWIKPTTSIATKAILVKNNEIRLVTDASGYLVCQIHNGADWQTAANSGAAIELNKWSQAGCSYDGLNLKVYINGVLKSATAMTADVQNTTNSFFAGKDAGGTYGRFSGTMDSIAIYDDALTSQEFADHYSRGNLYKDENNNLKFEIGNLSLSYDISNWTSGGWHMITALWNPDGINQVSGSSMLYGNLFVDGASAATSSTAFTTASSLPSTFYFAQDSQSNGQFGGTVYGLQADENNWKAADITAAYNSGTGIAPVASGKTNFTLSTASSTDVVAWQHSGSLANDGNFEDGDAAEFTSGENADASAQGGTVADESGLVGGWNYEDDLTDDSGNSKNGTLHTRPSCPTGYVYVFGNSAYNTSDFCVMQYEAKYDSNDDGTGDDAPSSCKYDTNYDTWDWGKDVATGCGYNVNEAARVVSTAAGSPIAGIAHTQALTACPAGDHMITNDEWMTIARDIEQVNANWTNGNVGSGCLFRGNSGETTCGYDGADPDKGTGRNARAKFTLSSGEEIYDISGNVWEHVKVDGSDTLISLAEQPEATSNGIDPISDADAFNWSDFTTGGGLSRWLLNNGTEPPLGYDVFRPSNSSWNASQGMGRIYHSSNSATATKNRVFLRGSNWFDEADAGAFALHLYWYASNQIYTVGVRCAR